MSQYVRVLALLFLFEHFASRCVLDVRTNLFKKDLACAPTLGFFGTSAALTQCVACPLPAHNAVTLAHSHTHTHSRRYMVARVMSATDRRLIRLNTGDSRVRADVCV